MAEHRLSVFLISQSCRRRAVRGNVAPGRVGCGGMRDEELDSLTLGSTYGLSDGVAVSARWIRSAASVRAISAHQRAHFTLGSLSRSCR